MNDLLFREMVSANGPLSGREIATISPVGGGCIHQAFCLDFTCGDRLFVKAGTASALAMFEVESEGLEALHRHADARVLAVPRPIGSWLLPSGSVLVLPWLKLGSGGQEARGRGLALMHRGSPARKLAWFLGGILLVLVGARWGTEVRKETAARHSMLHRTRWKQEGIQSFILNG